MTKIVNYVVILILALMFIACGHIAREKSVTGKYTIFVGGAALAIGYTTDGYTQDGDMITFIDKKGRKTMTVPLCSVFNIRENQ
jgi:hypothetical protein